MLIRRDVLVHVSNCFSQNSQKKALMYIAYLSRWLISDERLRMECTKLVLRRQNEMGLANHRLYKDIHNSGEASALSGSHGFEMSKSEIKCNTCRFMLRAHGLEERVGKACWLLKEPRVLTYLLRGWQDFVGTSWNLGLNVTSATS